MSKQKQRRNNDSKTVLCQVYAPYPIMSISLIYLVLCDFAFYCYLLVSCTVYMSIASWRQETRWCWDKRESFELISSFPPPSSSTTFPSFSYFHLKWGIGSHHLNKDWIENVHTVIIRFFVNIMIVTIWLVANFSKSLKV